MPELEPQSGEEAEQPDRQSYEPQNCGYRLPHKQHFHAPIGGLTLNCPGVAATEDSLTAALHEAIAALNTNSLSKRSAALYDLTEAVTRHLGREWNPYGQTRHPDGTITRKDEDIKP